MRACYGVFLGDDSAAEDHVIEIAHVSARMSAMAALSAPRANVR